MSAKIPVGHISVDPEDIGDALAQLDSVELGRALAVWMFRIRSRGFNGAMQANYIRRDLPKDVKAFIIEMLEEPKP